MANNKIKGITVEIGGDVTGLNKALGDTNKKIKDTQTELKQVERLLKLDPTNTELLAQKQRLLADNVELSRGKYETLQRAMESAGDVGEEAMNALKMETEAAAIQAEQAAQKFNDFSPVLENVKDGAKEVGDAFETIYQKSKLVSAGAGLVVGASAKAAMDLEATSAKYETVFGDMVEKVDGFITEFKKLTPATTAEARSMASGIQDLLVPMGFVREQATEMTGEFLHVIGALTNFNSATETAESVTQKISSAITGEYQGIKSLGVQLDATTVKQKAVEMGLANSTSEVTKQQQALVLLQEVYNQSGDALAAYNAESLDAKTKMELVKTAIEDSAASLGESLIPIINEFLGYLKGIIDSFNALDPSTKEMIVKMLALTAAIAPVAKAVSAVSGAVTPVVDGILGVASAAKGVLAVADPVYLTFVKWAAIIIAVVSAVALLVAAISALTGKGNDLANALQSAQAFSRSANASSLPMMASGGILSSGSAIVGEAGPELLTMNGGKAVVTPLSATVDPTSMASAMQQAGVGGSGDIKVNINYGGDLAQLGRILQPSIAVEASRRGVSYAGLR